MPALKSIVSLSGLASLVALTACKPSAESGATPKAASLTPREAGGEMQEFARPALRDGVWVLDGDMLVSSDRIARWGIVHYGRPWPGGRIPFRFSPEEQFRGEAKSREALRAAIAVVRERTELDWVEISSEQAPLGGFVEIRFWDKGWGSAQVGYVGEKQLVNLPEEPSLRLSLHELGHVMGLGHEHQHPERDRFVAVDRSCVPEEHRDSFAPRSKHVVSRAYDMNSVMHYRSAGFCRKDLVDADGDGNTRECAFVNDDPKQGKCYALRRRWGACRRENCEDRDQDGFREYIRGGATLSDGDVQTIHSLHREMLRPRWPSPSFGRAMVAGDTDGDGQAEIYVAAMSDGPCGALWELRPNASRTGLVRHRSSRVRWSCEADEQARVQLRVLAGSAGGGSELWVGISGPSTAPRGGWVEQWRRAERGEMELVRRYSPQDWNMAPSTSFAHSLAVHDRQGDGVADDLAIGAPAQEGAGRVYYARSLRRAQDDSSPQWAGMLGQLAGSTRVGESLTWLPAESDPQLVLSVGCRARDGAECGPSLWRWSTEQALRKELSSEALDLWSVDARAESPVASLIQGRGLWWMMPGACPQKGVFAGACGGAYWVQRAMGTLGVRSQGVFPGRLGQVKLRPQGLIPIGGQGGDAMIVHSRSGEAWVATVEQGRVRWFPIPVPPGFSGVPARDFTGWWDREGLYVVSAWTDANGERQMHLQSINLD